MTHRTRFMIAAMAPALAVVVMTVVAPGTNSQFTDTDTGTMNITFSNDPSRYPSDHVQLVHQSQPMHPPAPHHTTGPSDTAAPADEPSVTPPPSVEVEPTPTDPPSATPTPEEGSTPDEGSQ